MLHVIGLIIILMGLAVFTYLELQRFKNLKNEESNYAEKIDTVLKQRKLMEQRKNIVSDVHKFLKNSKFIKAIAMRSGDKIYQYIYSEGFLYEFKEILVGSNKKIGKDTENLCFRELSYNRVNNPENFLIEFADIISTTDTGNPNVLDGGLGLTNEEKEEFSIQEVEDKDEKNQPKVMTA